MKRKTIDFDVTGEHGTMSAAEPEAPRTLWQRLADKFDDPKRVEWLLIAIVTGGVTGSIIFSILSR